MISPQSTHDLINILGLPTARTSSVSCLGNIGEWTADLVARLTAGLSKLPTDPQILWVQRLWGNTVQDGPTVICCHTVKMMTLLMTIVVGKMVMMMTIMVVKKWHEYVRKSAETSP